jgi:hypothetical protein
MSDPDPPRTTLRSRTPSYQTNDQPVINAYLTLNPIDLMARSQLPRRTPQEREFLCFHIIRELCPYSVTSVMKMLMLAIVLMTMQ